MIEPELDGIDHINIYSKGKTELGRFLSNFSYSPINTEDGKFNSIEGYWYWLSTGKKFEKLRVLYGYKAKQVGEYLRKNNRFKYEPNFQDKIIKAIKIKLDTYKKYRELLLYTRLPLKHYYVYGVPGNQVIIEPNEQRWVVESIEKYRKINLIVEEING